MDTSKSRFTQYEISNFWKEGFFLQAQQQLLEREKYLGIGPSAHSFNGTDRQWNISNNVRYIQQIAKGTIPAEKEQN